MKPWYFIAQLLVIIFLSGYSCRHESNQPVLAQVNKPIAVNDSIQLLAFDKDIMPILKERCSPCHFTGGKMYEKMPFDDSKTMIGHRAGILKRFKGDEAIKIKAYLDQEKL